MEKFTKLSSIVAPLDRANVDTDQIIPKQFLKRIERTGFGEFAFFDWRYLEDGVPNPDFILNEDRYRNANILVSGRNFGSGSSREHAPWALMEMGYKAIISTSFADIFRNNCMQNGLLPVILEESDVDTIMARALRGSGYKVTVDLKTQSVTDDQGLNVVFDIDPFRKNSLLEGLDDVGITLTLDQSIDSFEEKRSARW
ncbi:MAG: 3-isopropylmalate dehydratase small subunit [SAR202 cluster bacterium]|mgnify:FL=1|nr:3-isopropylmalate dehydratase small subunit [Chloroflexota bacterium]MQG89040.1 3-isopropylmalate dehydratase small subunit [SAR202 cluster bacterium]